MKRGGLSATLLIGLCAAGSPCASAAPVPIVNPSFEEVSRPLLVGEVTNGCGGNRVRVGTRASFFSQPTFDDPVTIPGWRTLLPPPHNPTATIYAGVVNPPLFEQGPFLTNMHGQYAAALQISAMQQTLDALVRPGTIYTLRFKAGIGRFGTANGVYVALCAMPDRETLAFRNEPGVITLAALPPVKLPDQTAEQMTEFSFTYTAPDPLPTELEGKYLAISLQGSDGIPRMCFDDFRLEAVVPPPVCAGDTNGDNAVDGSDLSVLLAQFGTAVEPGTSGDVNDDGLVNGADLSVVLGEFGCGRN